MPLKAKIVGGRLDGRVIKCPPVKPGRFTFTRLRPIPERKGLYTAEIYYWDRIGRVWKFSHCCIARNGGDVTRHLNNLPPDHLLAQDDSDEG